MPFYESASLIDIVDMIDTHVHLNTEPLFNHWRDVCDKAARAGVRQCVVVGFDSSSSKRAVTIAESDTRCFAVIGLHPHVATDWNANCETELRKLATSERVVAIGEIGLDFYTGKNNERTLAPVAVQEVAFRGQIALARELGLPIVIHCREAYPETLAILEAESAGMTVILHCFAGNADEAKRAEAHGFYIGVGGTLTYKKNTELQAIVSSYPPELILLETDAPYLIPEPNRGKFPNLPEYLPHVAEKLAALNPAARPDDNTYRAFPRLRP